MSPENGAVGVFSDQKLVWAAPAGVANPVYNVYLGTDQSAVANAVPQAGDFDGNGIVGIPDLSHLMSWWMQDPAGSVPYVNLDDDDTIVNLEDFSVFSSIWQQPVPFKGSQTTTTFDPGRLTPGTQYYWRVDVIDGSTTNPGDLWSFETTPHDIEHFTACGPAGIYSGWPANYGAWNWGDEILVYVPQDTYFENPEHNTGSDAGHHLARSLDGGETWTVTPWDDVTINYVSGSLTPINFTDPNFALKVWHNQEETFYYSYDRGQSWNGAIVLDTTQFWFQLD